MATDLDPDRNAPLDAENGLRVAEWVVLVDNHEPCVRVDASRDELGWTPIPTPESPPSCPEGRSA